MNDSVRICASAVVRNGTMPVVLPITNVNKVASALRIEKITFVHAWPNVTGTSQNHSGTLLGDNKLEFYITGGAMSTSAFAEVRAGDYSANGLSSAINGMQSNTSSADLPLSFGMDTGIITYGVYADAPVQVRGYGQPVTQGVKTGRFSIIATSDRDFPTTTWATRTLQMRCSPLAKQMGFFRQDDFSNSFVAFALDTVSGWTLGTRTAIWTAPYGYDMRVGRARGGFNISVEGGESGCVQVTSIPQFETVIRPMQQNMALCDSVDISMNKFGEMIQYVNRDPTTHEITAKQIKLQFKWNTDNTMVDFGNYFMSLTLSVTLREEAETRKRDRHY